MNKEILWNIINSGIAGSLVLLGSIADGQITGTGIIVAVVASSIVAISQFQDYWKTKQEEYSNLCTKTKAVGGEKSEKVVEKKKKPKKLFVFFYF